MNNIAANQTNVPIVQPQVADWLERLEKEITLLEDMTGRVNHRFDSVLRGQPPEAMPPGKATPEEYLVMVASKLRDLHRVVQRCSVTLNNVVERAEL